MGSAAPTPSRQARLKLPSQDTDLARVNDFAVTGAEVLQAEVLKEHGRFLKTLIESTDRISKKARTLFFDPSAPRRIKATGTPWMVTIKGLFALEFKAGSRQLQQRSGQGVIYASLLIAAIPTFLIFAFCQNIIMRGIVVPVEK